jgi:hypothetical protein
MTHVHPTVFRSILCLLLFLLFSPAIWAEEKKNKSFDTFTLYWENDLFAGTDRNYTNGGLSSRWSERRFFMNSSSQTPSNVLIWVSGNQHLTRGFWAYPKWNP